jgi:Ni/Fe-hydrogenase subunit HybB-like protein
MIPNNSLTKGNVTGIYVQRKSPLQGLECLTSSFSALFYNYKYEEIIKLQVTITILDITHRHVFHFKLPAILGLSVPHRIVRITFPLRAQQVSGNVQSCDRFLILSAALFLSNFFSRGNNLLCRC